MVSPKGKRLWNWYDVHRIWHTQILLFLLIYCQQWHQPARPLHACQGFCDPVPPHSASLLTFCRPDSVTIVNTCCKGIMTAASRLSWQTQSQASSGTVSPWLWLLPALFTVLPAWRITEAKLFSAMFLSSLAFSHFTELYPASHTNKQQRRGEHQSDGPLCVISPSSIDSEDFRGKMILNIAAKLASEKLTPWQSFLGDSRSFDQRELTCAGACVCLLSLGMRF